MPTEKHYVDQELLKERLLASISEEDVIAFVADEYMLGLLITAVAERIRTCLDPRDREALTELLDGMHELRKIL